MSGPNVLSSSEAQIHFYMHQPGSLEGEDCFIFSLALRKLLCVTVRNLANQASASKRSQRCFQCWYEATVEASLTSVSGTSGLRSFTTADTYFSWKGRMETAFFFHSHLSIFPFFFLNRSWFDLSEGWGHSHPHSLQHSSQSAELQMHWWAACGCRRKKSPHKKRKEKNRKRDAERKTSQCNLLPQHSVSDVVWHLVHKPSSIHTLQ